MAKKQKVNRIIIAGAGIGVLLAVIIPVMIFVFGVGVETAPQVEPEELEVPVPVQDPDALLDPDPMDVVITAPNGTEVDNPDLQPEDEIDMKIDEIINMTETSEDPPIEQVIDEVFEPKAIQLEANVVKIDSTLQRFNETFVFDVPLASLFVEETTDIDFRNGFIELGLNIIIDPDTNIVADGTFNVRIEGVEIFPNDIALVSNGITDQEGKIKIQFVEPASQIRSDLFTFNFNEHFDKFTDGKVDLLSFVVNTLNIKVDPDQVNGLVDQELFSMEIFRDDILVFITDSQGNQVRSFPLDDRLTITTIKKNTVCTQTLCHPFTGDQCGFISGQATLGSPYVCFQGQAPSLGIVRVLDSTGNIVASGSGSGSVIDVLLFRNAQYTVQTQFGNFDITTPKSQRNYSYSCWEAIDLQATLITTSFKRAWVTTPIANSQHIECNFPS